jgi:protoheme IX farnesyltransferase
MSDVVVTTSVTEWGSWKDYLELSKSRIVVMILLTTAAGYCLSTSALNGFVLLHTLIGTALIAAGTNALNQFWERDLDARMERTRRRPLPDGRMSERAALTFSIAVAIGGAAYLWVLVHWLPAVLAITTLVTYLFFYTPLKQVTSLSLIVGAVPGALPPMIGWTAATHELSLAGWLAFGILFAWQLPHFLAIGWMYREDYARAGFRILSVQDANGRRSGIEAVAYSVLLLGISLLPTLFGVSGWIYFAGALLFGGAMLQTSIRFARETTDKAARGLFFASILYLPVVMFLLVADKIS